MNGPDASSEAPFSAPHHVPVMPHEVLRFLAPAEGQTVVDATVGTGGHAKLLAERLGPTGRLIALDRDPAMLAISRQNLSGLPVTFIHRNFDDLPTVLEELNIKAVDGILADLGISSAQLDDPARGLSFLQEGPLDMRLDTTVGEPASDLLRHLSERDLADIFYRYGEERASRRIARRIVARRRTDPFETTTELANLIRRVLPRSRGHRIDPATRVFQALRIAVNDELGALERFLANLPGCLRPRGKVVVISFHSLEDRLVKRAFRNRERFEELTRKPVQASAQEVRNNPRARSAKLRAALLKEEGEAK
jgi:16S rRNA (cytosine1402-N4)-methyltransferase